VSSVPLSETQMGGLPRRVTIASSSRPTRRPESEVSATAPDIAGEVVDDGEDAEAPAIAQLVMQKVERPALVGTLRQGQRCPGAERPPPSRLGVLTRAIRGIEAVLQCGLTRLVATPCWVRWRQRTRDAEQGQRLHSVPRSSSFSAASAQRRQSSPPIPKPIVS